jgi:hypothetical protein
MAVTDTPGIPAAQQRGPDVDLAEFLPPGVDPMDRSVIVGGSHPDHNRPTQPDLAGNTYQTGHQPYNKENWEALQVFQRSASTGSVKVVVVDINGGGTAQACQKQPGRISVTMSVPLKLADGVTVPNGVTWSFSEGDLQGPAATDCGVLNPGDSLTLYVECQLWVGLIGANTTGAVQVIQLMNPPSGPGVQ